MYSMSRSARDAMNSHEMHVSPLKITDLPPAGNLDWVKTELEHSTHPLKEVRGTRERRVIWTNYWKIAITMRRSILGSTNECCEE